LASDALLLSQVVWLEQILHSRVLLLQQILTFQQMLLEVRFQEHHYEEWTDGPQRNFLLLKLPHIHRENQNVQASKKLVVRIVVMVQSPNQMYTQRQFLKYYLHVMIPKCHGSQRPVR
jgi:hypothetical protein